MGGGGGAVGVYMCGVEGEGKVSRVNIHKFSNKN